jgi:hypothetical protein
MPNVRIMEQRLRRDYGLPDDFVFYRWECFPKSAERVLYYELEGARCPLVRTGKRKGKPNFTKKSDVREFQVTPSEDSDWTREWESETGKCENCLGEGREVSRISVADGTEYRQCSSCKARS